MNMAQFCVDCGAYDNTDSPQCPQCGAEDHKPVEYNPLKEIRRINFKKLEEMEYEVVSRRQYIWNLLVGKLQFAIKRGRRTRVALISGLTILITYVVVVLIRQLI
jgi:hypothetical protein